MGYDIAVIGCGIQGAGVAQAAAAAGYKVVVLEQTAIAAGTSSKSSKLIHGGLRYLETAQFKLVRKTLLERERLIKLAPDLVKPVKFYIPIYKNTKRKAWQIGVGLFLYQILGGFKKYTRFKCLNLKSQPIKNLRTDNLTAMFQYFDAQTDDAMLTKSVMQSAQALGADLICPAKVIGLPFNGSAYEIEIENMGSKIKADVVINVAGPWVNIVLDKVKGVVIEKMQCDLVQGAHIVIDAPAPDGIIYVEAPQDRRAVFIMPWKGKTLVGTTEKNYTGDPAKVMATEEEIQYLKEIYLHYMSTPNVKVVESFAGLRVLPEAEGSFFSRPRDTVIFKSAENLITLYGGKLTGYRVTAEDVLKEVKKILKVKTNKPLSTENIYLK